MQAIASQLTGYQLAAMQQHYALAAQQQLAPGMFLSSPYIIPAQHGVPTGLFQRDVNNISSCSGVLFVHRY